VKLAALVLAASLCLVSSAWAVSWRRPVPGPVLRAFALAPDRYARGQHRGVDLGAPVGTTVRAACGGRVRFAGALPRGGGTVSIGCGRLVATYQQLGSVAVRRGGVVGAGARIGTVGRSGDARDPRPHVHLGARAAASGRYVDPLTLFGAAPGAVPPVPPVAPVAPARRPRPVPRAPIPAVRAAPARAAQPAPAPGLPLVVWIGLLVFGLGLPLGGLVTRRRRRPGAPARRRRWAAAHR
jgi:murein DD-endopeptidase MepM/ murein hydrolase activator NlpD